MNKSSNRKFLGNDKTHAAGSLFLSAAVAGFLAAGGTALAGSSKNVKTKGVTTTTTDEVGKCLGANACKGKSDCNTATSSCAGENSCKQKGWLRMTQKECTQKHKGAKWEKLEG